MLGPSDILAGRSHRSAVGTNDLSVVWTVISLVSKVVAGAVDSGAPGTGECIGAEREKHLDRLAGLDFRLPVGLGVLISGPIGGALDAGTVRETVVVNIAGPADLAEGPGAPVGLGADTGVVTREGVVDGVFHVFLRSDFVWSPVCGIVG